MFYQHLSLTIENHFARVTLNRPPVNALGREFTAELIDAATQFKTDEEVWVIAVRAEGKVFCAGADFVMSGSIFAGHDECDGIVETFNDKKYKVYYGM